MSKGKRRPPRVQASGRQLVTLPGVPQPRRPPGSSDGPLDGSLDGPLDQDRPGEAGPELPAEDQRLSFFEDRHPRPDDVDDSDPADDDDLVYDEGDLVYDEGDLVYDEGGEAYDEGDEAYDEGDEAYDEGDPADGERLLLRGVLLAAGLVAVVLVTFFVVRQQMSADVPPQAQSGGTRYLATLPPVDAPSSGSYVRSRVTSTGVVRVTQWIQSQTPLAEITLSVPELSGGTDTSGVRATNVVVTADLAVQETPSTVTGRERVRFDVPATEVYVSYQLRGVVERSPSAPGRALARTTAMDLRYRPLGDQARVVLDDPKVLSMACTSAGGTTPRPCGAQEDGRWTVTLDGDARNDSVMAQLDLS